jgi:5-methylthioribose kinase
VFGRGSEIIVRELAGGVSSAVFEARVGPNSVVVKQALAQLRVPGGDWTADVRRSAVEARCAAVLNELVPGAVPRPILIDRSRNAFVMECAPAGSVTWKSELMAGVVVPDRATAAGQLLGQIHQRSRGRSELRREFGDRSLFEQLRVDPYLRTTAARHPDLRAPLGAVIELLEAPGECLVHGDYSPKNILVMPDGGLLLLDHEVAHWGEPAFDTAFCLTHLCLKSVAFPEYEQALLDAGDVFVSTYRDHGGPGATTSLERVPRIVGALMLARVDGRSPVEYLSQAAKGTVRQIARAVLLDPPRDVDRLLDRVRDGARR